MDNVNKYIIGIDQSLTDTGVVVLDIESRELVYQGDITSKPGGEPIHRILKIKEELREVITKVGPVQGVIEGFGFGARGNAVFDLGGLGYILRELFVEGGIKLLVIAPTSLKKYVTGKGNCKKDLMLLNIYKKWGVEFENDNIADAYGLARMGADMIYVKSTGDTDFLKKNNIDKKLVEDHYHQLIN